MVASNLPRGAVKDRMPRQKQGVPQNGEMNSVTVILRGSRTFVMGEDERLTSRNVPDRDSAVSSSHSHSSDPGNLERFLQHTTPRVRLQCVPKVWHLPLLLVGHTRCR